MSYTVLNKTIFPVVLCHCETRSLNLREEPWKQSFQESIWNLWYINCALYS